MRSSPTIHLTIYPTFSDVHFTQRFILRRSIECVFRPLAETHPPTGYEPKDLSEEDNSILVKPMFFHRPSKTSTFDSAESIATRLLDRVGMMSEYGICWLHRLYLQERERSKCRPITSLSLLQRKLSVKFISLPRKCRETCRNVLTKKKVESRRMQDVNQFKEKDESFFRFSDPEEAARK